MTKEQNILHPGNKKCTVCRLLKKIHGSSGYAKHILFSLA